MFWPSFSHLCDYLSINSTCSPKHTYWNVLKIINLCVLLRKLCMSLLIKEDRNQLKLYAIIICLLMESSHFHSPNGRHDTCVCSRYGRRKQDGHSFHKLPSFSYVKEFTWLFWVIYQPMVNILSQISTL